MNWWYFNGDCLKCNNTGMVPTLAYYDMLGKLFARESMSICDCNKRNRVTITKEKNVTDDFGKTTKVKVKEAISVNHPGIFQFPWTAQIMRFREPWVDYHEVYQIYKNYHRDKRLKEDNYDITRSMDVLNKHFKTTFQELPSYR